MVTAWPVGPLHGGPHPMIEFPTYTEAQPAIRSFLASGFVIEDRYSWVDGSGYVVLVNRAEQQATEIGWDR